MNMINHVVRLHCTHIIQLDTRIVDDNIIVIRSSTHTSMHIMVARIRDLVLAHRIARINATIVMMTLVVALTIVTMSSVLIVAS